MTALEMIQEYRKGCSNGKDCLECASALIDALEKKLSVKTRVTIITLFSGVETVTHEGFLTDEEVFEKHNRKFVVSIDRSDNSDNPKGVF